ncbi:KpsF/GutQ family sugar-phosphate isomerase [Hyphococcus luteus]|uniref:KpsF/GutQ family sugar-phosphate isomerase n=1 Tax=Hyphococcus luteus TaxID=2058213 RepID=A0A2S7K7U0_9PROT|nr:KpsF/GutQ family sugar-phosphate isomerase [Marinicaulis flavus]PQA88551.1 KpsF/GutQ family sugar-phosphate isomerase [Marinicaulis flavus]
MNNSSGDHENIEFGLDIIATEIDGLEALRAVLADRKGAFAAAFDSATELLLRNTGRVIVTGMGKSGHVARKIAATLASTGAPAAFVHPGEASHGDLGMIGAGDVVLALSNSGETAELGDIIGYAGRFDIPLIAMTAGAQSTLARAADIALILPGAREACAITGAPTTSTTMTMALGDALAVTILRRKGFTANDFHQFHPGGKLGAALKHVTELMHHTDMPLCRPADTVAHAVDVISKMGFGCTGVVDDDGALIGMVTDGDLRRHFSRSLKDAQVKDIMTADPQVVRETSLAAEALALLSGRKITAVFIVDENRRPLGLLHVHDCLSVGVL